MTPNETTLFKGLLHVYEGGELRMVLLKAVREWASQRAREREFNAEETAKTKALRGGNMLVAFKEQLEYRSPGKIWDAQLTLNFRKTGNIHIFCISTSQILNETCLY